MRFAVVLSLVAAGCYAQVDAGYASPFGNHPGDRGFVMDAHGGMLVTENDARDALAVGMTARGKLSEDVDSGAMAAEVTWIGRPWLAATPFARASVNLINMGRVDGGFDIGTGSPYGEIGLQVPFGRAVGQCRLLETPHRTFVSLAVGAGYDLWLGDAPSRGAVLFKLGFGQREKAAPCKTK